MKRVVPLVVLLLAAVGVAGWFLSTGAVGGAQTPENVLAIEQAIASGDLAGARSQLGVARAGLPGGYADYLEGLMLFAEGKVAEATKRLEAAHAVGLDDPRVTDALLSGLFAMGRFDDAQQVVAVYTERHPEQPRALWFRALLETHAANPERSAARGLEFLNRIDRARERLESAGADDPDDGLRPAALLELRARCLSETGRHRSAVEVARALVAEAPTYQEGWITLGDVARMAARDGSQEYTQTALQAYQRASELPPPRKHVMMLLIDAMLQTRGLEQDTVALTAQLLAANPGDREFRILRARACVRTDEPERMDEAHDIYRTLLTENPDDTEVLRNLAVLLYDWKQGGQEGVYLREAYALLRRYVQLGGQVDGHLHEVMRVLLQKARAAGVLPEKGPPEEPPPVEDPPPAQDPEEASVESPGGR